MHITMVGTGYVGLVTGTCFAEMGNHVTCIDIDESKLHLLRSGVVPIHEPGLESMVKANVASKRLGFSNDLPTAINDSEVTFIAVGTPPSEDGSADLKHVLAVAREIGQTMDRSIVVVNKSTVPVGTADKVTAEIQNELDRRGLDLEFSPLGDNQ